MKSKAANLKGPKTGLCRIQRARERELINQLTGFIKINVFLLVIAYSSKMDSHAKELDYQGRSFSTILPDILSDTMSRKRGMKKTT